ncbi:MAG: distal tail protein Dit [Bacteroidales bacterium]
MTREGLYVPLPEGVDLYVNENRILEPLGLVVLRDSRVDLLPRTKDLIENVPGRHGDIFFGSKLLPRLLELRVAIDSEFSPEEMEKKKREIARFLVPTKGTKTLVFADEPEKQYFVKYSGTIDITQYATWFEFTIPFKCSDPYIYSRLNEEEKIIEESPDAISITSNGNLDSFPVVELKNEGENTINGFVICTLEEV